MNSAGRRESERVGDAAVLSIVPSTCGVGTDVGSAFSFAFAFELALAAVMPLKSCANLIVAVDNKSASLGSWGWSRLVA